MQKPLVISFKMSYNNYICAKKQFDFTIQKKKRKVKEKDDESKQMDESNKLSSSPVVGACYGALCSDLPDQGHYRADCRFHH